MHTKTLREPFDPHAHRAALSAILDEIAREAVLDARALDRIVKRHPKGGASLFSKSEILAGLRAFAPGSEPELAARLRMRPVRTLSGVTPVAVLTRPHPCPGTCIFCPSDVRMPKSYLADEPGAQRAEQHRFDPYLQVWHRLQAYSQIGHPVDKVELIVLGGTWSSYPVPYQIWFTLRCFEALSDFGAGVDARADAGAAPAPYRELRALDGRRDDDRYNAAVAPLLRRALGPAQLHASEQASWDELALAQRRNESARCRAVGLCFETRPDHVDAAEVLQLRRLGATKVQLGVQSTDDALLARNGRGHDLAATRAAFSWLRGAGMKIHAHWMPNLLGATPESDAADFLRLFSDLGLRPDELKIYPCLLVASAPLAAEHARGAWQPYADDVLADLLAHCLAHTPRWCRLTRVVRDFASQDIAAGTRVANLREVVERRLDAQGLPRLDIRSREVRGAAVDEAALALRESSYATSDGEERFLEWCTPDDRIAAFVRLSLPRGAAPLAELAGHAIVRELHVYGPSLPLAERAAGSAQHAGLGQRLLAEAAERARAAGFGRLAVISAVGTRAYYRARGFADGELYQSLELR
ncbi:MAG TPA: tRNA uridine(34) 5-carboxymethylaminomethyl modification radical SAM/GNAT enzyme Elp3 [Myxococcota bacterium]|nr:tRNA uridine(34) 5-carboxymethylaminomethyl modification radical SAM/GNAT enzyme Elp3 [Myxococcota bacterium]